MLDAAAIKRYRADPAAFVDEVLINPATGKPYVLLDAEKTFLKHAFKLDRNGKMKFPLLTYSAIKKSGKTEFGGIFVVTLIVLFGERFAEGFCVANDLEQAQSRVFQICKRLVEASPLLKNEARVLQDEITFPSTGAKIIPVAGSDYAGAAGAHPSITVFDELWGFTSERARRVFDEFVPVPTRQISCRLIVSHAGFENESELLREIYVRGTKQPKIGKDLFAGDGMLTFWSHTPIASWQDEQWLDEMRRSLRPTQYLRMIENRFVTSESTFIPMDLFDACVDPNLTQTLVDKRLPVCVGLDASVVRDSTAISVMTSDRQGCQRMVWHRIYTPSKDRPIDFEDVLETLYVIRSRYSVRKIVFDPYQLESIAQRLTAAGFPMEKMPQTSGNLTAIGSCLYDLIKARKIAFYQDDAIRLAMSRCVAIESGRGWKITKEKSSHHIDIVVATAMAAHACLQDAAQPEGIVALFNRNPDVLNSGDHVAPAFGTNPYNRPVLGGERTTLQMQRYGGRGIDAWKPPFGFR